MKEKRKYEKRSEYWDQFKKNDKPIEDVTSFQVSASDTTPSTAGEPIYAETSFGSRRAAYSGASGSRRNTAHVNAKANKYTNIRNGLLPFEYSRDGTNVRDAIELCQKAYANVAIFRNAIDIMAEFSNSNIYLEGENEKSKKFIEKWFERIGLWKLKDQYFREYYRSGNIFLYRLDGKFTIEDFTRLNYVYGSDQKPGYAN